LGKEVVLMRRILLLLMTVAAMVATMAASAAATKPVVEEPLDPIEGDMEVADCNEVGVGKFHVRDDFVFTFTAKLFFDENGELIMIVEQIRGTDTFYSPETGKQFTSRFQNTEHIDPAADTDAVTGVISLLTVPGSGAVLLDVGRIVFEGGDVTFDAGPHQVVGGDVEGLCEALAPPPQEEE
jgi:hypothetical protein